MSNGTKVRTPDSGRLGTWCIVIPWLLRGVAGRHPLGQAPSITLHLPKHAPSCVWHVSSLRGKMDWNCCPNSVECVAIILEKFNVEYIPEWLVHCMGEGLSSVLLEIVFPPTLGWIFPFLADGEEKCLHLHCVMDSKEAPLKLWAERSSRNWTLQHNKSDDENTPTPLKNTTAGNNRA